MSEGAAFNAHWNTPLEAMNGTIDLADAYYCKDGKPTTDTKIAELNGGGAWMSASLILLILRIVIRVYIALCLFPVCFGTVKEV